MKKIIILVAISLIMASCNTYYIVIEESYTEDTETSTNELQSANQEENLHFEKQIGVIKDLDKVKKIVKDYQDSTNFKK